MPYFIAISRPLAGARTVVGPWGVQFGDRDQQTVKDEVRGMKDGDKREGYKAEYKIVKAATMRKADVKAALEPYGLDHA